MPHEALPRVEARGVWFSKCQEKSERLIGSRNQLRGTELGDALPDEDFQVLRRREGRACHQIDDILVALRKTGVSTDAMYRTDGGVRVYEDGARVGLSLAAAKVCNP